MSADAATTAPHVEPGENAQAVDMLAAAREYNDASLCVVPVKADGSKTPDLRGWSEYKERCSTPAEHDSWFNPQRRGGARQGIGIVYGRVSGNVEMIEFEGRAVDEGIVDEVADVMEAVGLGQVWKTIMEGWVTRSPSGGLHLRIRVEGAPVKGNTRLACRLARDEELTSDERARLSKNPNAQIVRVLIETRGEAGFAVAEPSHGTVHQSGKPYTRITGGPDTIPTIDAQQYQDLHVTLRAVDQMPQKETPKSAPKQSRTPLPGDRLRPGDDFENRAEWSEILTPHGWQFLFQRGRTSYWRRPGKDRGPASATTGHAPDRDRLFVFSSSTDFAMQVAYTKFAAYALLNHGGDFKAAARDLQRQGYGDRPVHKPLDSNILQFRPRNVPPTDGANALAADAPPPPESAPKGSRSKPRIDITREAYGIQNILDVMADGLMPDLYTRTGSITWVEVDEQGHPVMHALTADNLRAYLHQYTATVVQVKDEDGSTHDEWELPRSSTCATILGLKTWPLPKLRGIVTSPVVRPDGTLLCESGFDAQTGLYLHPHAPLRRLGPVTPEQVAKAKHIILGQMLADFPWVAPSDKAHMVGALLTPILRPFFHGPTPGFVMTAASAGSGKTLLKDIFGFCYGISSVAWSIADEELRKSITAQLFTQGQPVVAFDNLPNGHIIKSAQLSTLLTGEFWGDRILGRTEAVQVRNDRLWLLTGNGLQTGGDNARRVVWIRIDPDCPNPDERDGFVIGDLRPWLLANASTVVAALVTMVRGWLTLGHQQRKNVRFGDYSEWASMMAGILDYLEIPGWLADRTTAAAGRDAEKQEWAALLVAWHEKFGEREVKAGEVVAALADFVPQPGGKPVDKRQFGKWLTTRNGQFFGDFKLIGTPDSHAGQNVWMVRPIAQKDAGGSQ